MLKTLSKLFTRQKEHVKFGEFISSLEEKCQACSVSCGNEWCPFFIDKEKNKEGNNNKNNNNSKE